MRAKSNAMTMVEADVLVIIDMQNGVCHYEGQTIPQFDLIVPGINERLRQFISQDKPVIFVQHTDEYLVKDSQKWAVIPELNQVTNAYFIEKKHPNAFYETNLKEILKTIGAEKLEICGAETEYCVDATIKFAHGSGYAVYVKKGLYTAWDSELLTAEDMSRFYEDIWDERFVTFI